MLNGLNCVSETPEAVGGKFGAAARAGGPREGRGGRRGAAPGTRPPPTRGAPPTTPPLRRPARRRPRRTPPRASRRAWRPSARGWRLSRRPARQARWTCWCGCRAAGVPRAGAARRQWVAGFGRAGAADCAPWLCEAAEGDARESPGRSARLFPGVGKTGAGDCCSAGAKWQAHAALVLAWYGGHCKPALLKHAGRVLVKARLYVIRLS